MSRTLQRQLHVAAGERISALPETGKKMVAHPPGRCAVDLGSFDCVYGRIGSGAADVSVPLIAHALHLGPLGLLP